MPHRNTKQHVAQDSMTRTTEGTGKCQQGRPKAKQAPEQEDGPSMPDVNNDGQKPFRAQMQNGRQSHSREQKTTLLTETLVRGFKAFEPHFLRASTISETPKVMNTRRAPLPTRIPEIDGQWII